MRRLETPLLAGLALSLTLLSLPPTAAAGGWTRPRGGGYVKGWIREQAAIGFLDGYHDDGGDFRYFGNYSETGIHGYLEYGVLDRLTLIANWAPLKLYAVQQDRRRVVRPSDPEIGARWGIVQGEFVAALQTNVSIPMVTNRSFGAIREVDMATGRRGEVIGQLQVGSGVWGLEPRAQLGFGTARGHFGLEIGWRFRSGGYQDSLVWLVEGGYRFLDPLYVTFRMTHVNPQGPGRVEPNTGSPSGVTSGTLYLGYAFEVDYRLQEGLSVGASLEGATVYARQAGGPVISVYVAHEWGAPE